MLNLKLLFWELFLSALWLTGLIIYKKNKGVKMEKKDDHKEMKICNVCERDNNISANICRNCGEEFIVTAEEGVSSGEGVVSISPPDDVLPTPPSPSIKPSEVRIIADRLGLDKDMSDADCSDVINDISVFCNNTIHSLREEQIPLFEQIKAIERELIRARALLKQTEVRPFEGD